MTLNIGDAVRQLRAKGEPWLEPASYWGAMTEATKSYPAPVVALNRDAIVFNASDMRRRAGGIAIRVASKSIRVRGVLEEILATPGFNGILAYTVSEANWLAETLELGGKEPDILVAYPSVNRAALSELAGDERKARAVTIMVDSVAQLDLIDAVTPPHDRQTIRVCLDFDASYHHPVLGNVGVLRSPVHDAQSLQRLAQEVVKRPGFKLVGVMSYEAQIAGVGNSSSKKPVMGRVMQAVQAASAKELAARRAKAIGLVSQLAELEFVNGGGTGSLESTAAEAVVTELAAGSGFFGPHLFDNYEHFQPAPAVAFALDVVRKATPDTATVLGGGWAASGVAGPDRLPQPVWPEQLKYSSREGAGEVQTPLLGAGAKNLKPGDRVWFRHTKSGEIMEHGNSVVVVSGSEVLGELPTYRGEGRAFL